MALPHARPGDVVQLLPAAVSAEQHSRSTAIFKSSDLEVLRLVLRAGDYLPPHRVPGGITVQCLHGALELGVDGDKCKMQAGQMCYLPGGALHDVSAPEYCVALVTIALSS